MILIQSTVNPDGKYVDVKKEPINTAKWNVDHFACVGVKKENKPRKGGAGFEDETASEYLERFAKVKAK